MPIGKRKPPPHQDSSNLSVNNRDCRQAGRWGHKGPDQHPDHNRYIADWQEKSTIYLLNGRFVDAEAIENEALKTVGKSFRFMLF